MFVASQNEFYASANSVRFAAPEREVRRSDPGIIPQSRSQSASLLRAAILKVVSGRDWNLRRPSDLLASLSPVSCALN